MKILETDRLILREWQEDDAADLFEFGKNQSVTNAGWSTRKSIDDSINSIRVWIKEQVMWPIVLKENNKVIGAISLCDIDRHDRYRTIEYLISDDYTNTGYATEAVKRILEYSFTELDLLVVAACHYDFNVQSKRVIEKCGFTYEGTLRKYNRNLSNSVQYSILKEEWEKLHTIQAFSPLP